MGRVWNDPITGLYNKIRQNWRVILFLLIGIAVRMLPVLQSDYPLGEGGLFYYVIQYIAERGTLPREIPYYSCGLPFAYPPLGLAMHGIILRYTSFPLFTILKWSPLFFSVLSLLAFALLSARFLKGLARELATLSFATMPAVVARITASDSIRNLALFFMLLGLSLLHEALSQDGPERDLMRNAIAAGLCGGLVILTHPPIGLGSATVMVLFMVYFVYKRRTRLLIQVVLLALCTAILVTGIWFLVLFYLHGIGFLSLLANAFNSRPHKSIWFLTMLELGATSTGEPFADLWAVTGSIGLIYGFVTGNPLPAFWFLVTPIHWANQVYAVPLAIGAGWGLGEVIAPAIVQKAGRLRTALTSLLFVALVGYTTIVALTLSIRPETPLVGRLWSTLGMQPQVSSARLEAWDWIANHIPENAQVALVAEEKEWVPALAHVCANIPQGAEWIGKFLYYGEMYNRLINTSNAEDLFALLQEYGQAVEYVYISTKISPSFRISVHNNLDLLRKSLEEQGCVTRLFENSEVVLYDVRGCLQGLQWSSEGGK